MTAQNSAAAAPAAPVLQGAVAVVTGAAAGIGAAVAQALGRAGARVVGVDAAPAAGAEAAVEHHLRVDLADAAATADVIPDVVRRFGRLDVLVNNAGLARHASVPDIDLAELDLMWAVNVRATVQLTRDAMRAMTAGGRIVNVVSTAGLRGEPGESAYCATKFAVRGFTEAAAEEGRVSGVGVHAVFPAGVATAFWDGAVGDRAGFVGEKEFLTPDDVAAQVLHLLTTPLGVEVPALVVRHRGDADLDAVRAKLERVRR